MWKKYKAHFTDPGSVCFYQKMIDTEREIYADIVEWNHFGKSYELKIQIPHDESITGKTININVFSYDNLDFEKIDKDARKIIKKLLMSHVNTNCKDETLCREHGEEGEVTYMTYEEKVLESFKEQFHIGQGRKWILTEEESKEIKSFISSALKKQQEEIQNKLFLDGVETALDFVRCRMGGSAGRMFDLHSYPLREWIKEGRKITNLKNKGL